MHPIIETIVGDVDTKHCQCGNDAAHLWASVNGQRSDIGHADVELFSHPVQTHPVLGVVGERAIRVNRHDE
jgi:hypothetical protein